MRVVLILILICSPSQSQYRQLYQVSRRCANHQDDARHRVPVRPVSAWQVPASPRGSLRTRLVVAMVALAISVLAFTALATLTIARRTNADNTQKQLESKAPELASALDGFISARNIPA